MSNRLNKDREAKLQPQRMQKAVFKIYKLGYLIIHQTETDLKFCYKGEIITYYPYSGWHTGKSIKDGRGLEKLLKQINNP